MLLTADSSTLSMSLYLTITNVLEVGQMARKKYLKVGMEGVVVHGRVSTVREGPDSMAVRGPAIPSCAPELGGPQNELGGPQNELGGPKNKLGGPQNELEGPQNELRGPQIELRGDF